MIKREPTQLKRQTDVEIKEIQIYRQEDREIGRERKAAACEGGLKRERERERQRYGRACLRVFIS